MLTDFAPPALPCSSPLPAAAVAAAGVSGAGRSAKQNLLYTEVTEGINAYGVTRHRHMPEIEQGLSDAAGKPVLVRWVAEGGWADGRGRVAWGGGAGWHTWERRPGRLQCAAGPDPARPQ